MTTIPAISHSNIVAAFPYPTLTPITARPTHSSLKALQQALNSNARSVHSDLGDGTRGHLALTMTDEAFLVLTGNVAFVIPINPGPFADHPAGATVAQITEGNKQHAIARHSFQLYNTVQAALRNQLIAAVPDTYIRKLRIDYEGYGAVTILQFLTHLFLHYGKIDASELSENLTRMNLPWNPPTPIETLYTQLTEGVAFAAAAGEVIPATWIVRSG